VLQEAAGPGVVGLLGRREDAQPCAEIGEAGKARDEPSQARVGDLGGQELEEAVQLVDVAARLRHELGRVVVGRLERAHLELEPVAEALHAAEHADGVALAEALVEELDVVPDTRLDPPGRVDQLEGEVGAPGPGAEPLLAGDR
jgi:hypothetical protein